MAKANPFTTDSDTPKPSVPEFILKFVDNSYDVPPRAVSSTDPYTRVTTNTTYPSYHAENKSIEVIITNQPISSLYYNVALKDHNSENWTIYSYYNDHNYYYYGIKDYLQASNSDTTVLVFGLDGNNGPDTYNLKIVNLHGDVQIDFQVQAITLFWNRILEVDPVQNKSYVWNVANLESSGGWSPTQTITIPQSSPSPSPSPTPTLADTESPIQQPTLELSPTPNNTQENSTPTLILVGLMIVVAVTVLLVYCTKRRGLK